MGKESTAVGVSNDSEMVRHVVNILIQQGKIAPVIRDKYLSLAGAVEEVTPDVLPLYAKLSSTGAVLAQAAAVNSLHSLLLGISQNKDLSPSSHAITHADIYREQLEYYTQMPMTKQMVLAWHFNNVASALNMDKYGVDRLIHWFMETCTKNSDHDINDDLYWRGVAALHLTINSYQTIDLGSHEEFIAWSGSSDDVARVIALGRDRGNVDTRELRTIMAQQDSTASSVRDGVL